MKTGVVAFSGGLDTSFLVPFVREKYGIEHIITCAVDTGGFDEAEIKRIADRAKEIGADDHVHIDASEMFYNEIIKNMIFGNITRDGYPLCVGTERLIQAREAMKIAIDRGADTLIHGSTGAGNDQYRFDLVVHVLGNGAVESLAPVREHNIKREFSQNYLKERGISVSDKAAYSYNVGLWGVSIGGVETHKSDGLIPEHAWYKQIDPALSDETLTIIFEKGEVKSLTNRSVSINNPVEIIQYIADIAGRMGIGRHYHVGTSIPGKKGRLGYESPAADILYAAHTTLEKHVMSQEQIFYKKDVAQTYGRMVHEAKLFDPLMTDLTAFLQSSQSRVTGECVVHLKPHRIAAVTVNTPYDLLSAGDSEYGEFSDAYTGDEAKGSALINAYEQRLYHSLKD